MFSGSDYQPRNDDKRLTKQLDVIRDVMLSAGECGTWLTLREISQLTHYGESSISAQLRNLRKMEFGAFVLEKRSRGDRSHGLYEYRLTPPSPQEAKQLDLLEGRAHEARRRTDATDDPWARLRFCACSYFCVPAFANAVSVLGDLAMRDNTKLKRFPISDLALLTTYAAENEIHAKITQGFPKDALIVRHYYARELHTYFIVVQSEEFEPVKNGEVIPMGAITAMSLPCREKTEKE